MTEMTPEELGSALKKQYDTAQNYQEYLEQIQRHAFEYYEAQPFGNEIEGRSQIVLPDVQEVIDDTNAALLRMFVSGDRTIEFEAVNEDDEQAADDATAALDYNFMRKQDGYGVLNDVIQDGNLRKLGVFKACQEVTEKVTRTWEVVPAEALPLLLATEEVEDIREFEQETELGVLQMARVLIKRETEEVCWNLVAVPTHEFRFTPNSRHEDNSDYVGQAQPKRRSELVAMGFDREQVYELSGYVEDIDNESESDTLDQYVRHEAQEELRRVLLCEEYCRIDVDGDGIAELVKAYRVENEVLRYQGDPALDEFGEQIIDERGEPVFQEGELAVETVDEQPFSVYCPFPRPHRMIGYSLAEKVMDIQHVRSHLLRQMLDGMNYANNPRHIVSEDGSSDNTLDDILNPIPGSPIRTRTQGAVVPITNSFNIGQSLQAIEWFSREKEARSGSGRSTPVAGEDALNNMTATEFAGRQSKGEALQEYMARNLAESFSRGMMKLYRMMRVGAEPFQIKVDGKYRTVDPSSWPESMNMTTRVGLGTGSKDKRLQARMGLLPAVRELVAEGLAGPEHVFKQFDGIMRDFDMGRGDDIMFDPADEEVAARLEQQQNEPSPEVIEARGKVENDRAKMAFEADLAAFKLERDLELQAARLSGELDLAAFRAETEAQLARFKTRFEIENKKNLTDQRMGGSMAS